jgi:hypothetical protein
VSFSPPSGVTEYQLHGELANSMQPTNSTGIFSDRLFDHVADKPVVSLLFNWTAVAHSDVVQIPLSSYFEIGHNDSMNAASF